MKSPLLAFLLILVCAVPVFAQLYDKKPEVMVDPMDRAARQTQDYYANVTGLRDEEEAKPQDVRYSEALAPMNEANERHFETGTGISTVIELEQKK